MPLSAQRHAAFQKRRELGLESIERTGQRVKMQWIKSLLGLAVWGLMLLSGGSALALDMQSSLTQTVASQTLQPQWQLTGQSTDGLAQQYVDLNSIQPYGEAAAHQWSVESYFTERKVNEQVRADYVTLYDCDRHLYKDVNAEGIPAPSWGAATADPLNQATLDFVCDRAAHQQPSN